MEYGIRKARPPKKLSPPQVCERCLGLVFWLALIPHLTHLQLKGPSLSLHVLPSVGSLSPDQPQLPALLLPLLLELPSDRGGEGRERERKTVIYAHNVIHNALICLIRSLSLFPLPHVEGERGEEVEWETIMERGEVSLQHYTTL